MPEGDNRARATEVTEKRDGECAEQVLAPGDQLISCRSHRESELAVVPTILIGGLFAFIGGLVVWELAGAAANNH